MIRRFITFPKGISTKGNVISRLEFELAYFETTVQHFSHYATWALPSGYSRGGKNIVIFNLRSSLLRCGTRSNEWGTQWDSKSLLLVKLANHYTTRGARGGKNITGTTEPQFFYAVTNMFNTIRPTCGSCYILGEGELTFLCAVYQGLQLSPLVCHIVLNMLN